MKLNVTYGVKRSGSYQTVNVELSIEREFPDTEQTHLAFRSVMQEIAPLVEAEADATLKDAIRASKG